MEFKGRVDGDSEAFALNKNMIQQSAIILGPRSSGKTAIAFQEALTASVHQNNHVIICTVEERAKRQCPLSIPSIDLSNNQPVALNNIHMKYFDPSQGSAPLLSYFSHFHLLQRQPHLIILDDLTLFCPTYEDKLRMAALLQKVCVHATVLHEWNKSTLDDSNAAPSDPCRVIITDSFNDVGEYPDLTAFPHLMNSLWQTKSLTPHSFEIKKINLASNTTSTQSSWTYNISKGTMALQSTTHVS